MILYIYLLYVIVISTGLLHPLPGWYDIVAELGLIRARGWCYPLCVLVTLVLRLIGFYNPCRLGTEMVALVRVIRLVHILLPVPYTPRVALYIHLSATSIAGMV